MKDSTRERIDVRYLSGDDGARAWGGGHHVGWYTACNLGGVQINCDRDPITRIGSGGGRADDPQGRNFVTVRIVRYLLAIAIELGSAQMRLRIPSIAPTSEVGVASAGVFDGRGVTHVRRDCEREGIRATAAQRGERLVPEVGTELDLDRASRALGDVRQGYSVSPPLCDVPRLHVIPGGATYTRATDRYHARDTAGAQIRLPLGRPDQANRGEE